MSLFSALLKNRSNYYNNRKRNQFQSCVCRSSLRPPKVYFLLAPNKGCDRRKPFHSTNKQWIIEKVNVLVIKQRFETSRELDNSFAFLKRFFLHQKALFRLDKKIRALKRLLCQALVHVTSSFVIDFFEIPLLKRRLSAKLFAFVSELALSP